MLYAITDSTLLADNLLSACEQALAGGCQWLQYRDKSQDATKRLREALALKALCAQYQAKLIINDDVALAEAVAADGVHLGQGDGSVSAARERLGERAIIGITCHDQIALAQRGLKEGASYIAFGAFFPSKTKPGAQPAPLSLLSEAAQLGAPVIAIGGINVSNCQAVVKAGATGIAVCHSLFAAEDIKLQAQRFCEAIDAGAQAGKAN